MSFLNDLGKGIVSAGKSLAKTIGEQVDKYNKNQEKWENYKRLKLQIVGNLPINELKKICTQYGVGEPNMYWINPLDGRKESLGNPRDLYLKHIVLKVPLDDLINYAKNKKIPTSNIIAEKFKIDNTFNKSSNSKSDNFEKEMGSMEEKTESDFEKILRVLEGFNPDVVRDEKDLENQLKQWLRVKLTNNNIDTQFKLGSGDLIDIMIDSQYGLELKLVENNKVLENLYGQVKKYIDILGKNKLALVLLVNDNVSENYLDKWSRDYEELGAIVIILSNGKIKRKKRKTTLWIQRQ